jgi:hypothetical protein
MGFTKVGGKANFADIKKASEMEVDETLTGHLVRVEPSRGEFEGYNFVLRTEAGDILVYGTGTLKYVGKDTLEGNSNALTLGANTRITAKGKEKRQNKSSGKKYEIAVFDVEQDTDDMIAVGESARFNAVFDGGDNAPTSTKSATDKGIAAASARLAGVAGGRK